jgi:hypothetical protein
MTKQKVIRAICARESGSIQNPRVEEKRVIVDFIGETNKEPKPVLFTNLRFPNHKFQAAAEKLKDSVLEPSPA